MWLSDQVIIQNIDSYIGKLLPILNADDRTGDWDKRLDLGNSATHKLLKDYLRLVTGEQLQVRVKPKKAAPFFVDKLARLGTHIDQNLTSPSQTPTRRFMLARDQAYLKAVFFSGDRPGDMSRVKVPEIVLFPNDDGFLFNNISRKRCETGIPMFLEIVKTHSKPFVLFLA